MEETIMTSAYAELHTMDQLARRIRTDLNMFHAFQLMQSTVVFFTLTYGFCILMQSLFARLRTTVWGLWITFLCGFIQVCYCAANVFAARQKEIYQVPVPFQCSDIYTIPVLCDVISMAALVSSAVGVNFRQSKVGFLFKLIFFPYILVCMLCFVAINSGEQSQLPAKLYITRQISFQSVSCMNSRGNDLFLVALESLLIYIPMSIILLAVNYRYTRNKDSDSRLWFFKPCSPDTICGVCQYTNSVCKVVFVSFSGCLLILRPIDNIASSIYDLSHQNIIPSLISTAVYVYLCFEYSIILQNKCKSSAKTQTDECLITHEKEVVYTVVKDGPNENGEIQKELLVPFSIPSCV